MTKAQKAQAAESRERLLKILKPGDPVYTVLRHVSRSGMSRNIDLYALVDNEPLRLSGYAASACGWRLAKRDQSITVRGCGMDMGFHLVYNLSRTLFADGWQCIGDQCPSNDHSNGDRNRDPHPHSDGGYALRHRWM